METSARRRVVFLCGDRSPYGLAHLEPILSAGFEVIAVVVPTDERWQRFRESLLGKRFHLPPPPPPFWKRVHRRVKRAFSGVPGKPSPQPALSLPVPLMHVFDVNAEDFLEQL